MPLAEGRFFPGKITMSTILLIDDEPHFRGLSMNMLRRDIYPDLNVLTCNDPIKCLINITTDLDLLLVDLEMPGLDGSKILSYATSKGLNKNPYHHNFRSGCRLFA